MADFTDHLTDKHIAMIEKQPMFFVATATSSGRINLSGNETHAHLADDGRITIMFNNFDQPALILRIYGRGVPVLPQDEGWDKLAAHFTLLPGTRQIFAIQVESVQTSCGWGVPKMTFEEERETLKKAHRQEAKRTFGTPFASPPAAGNGSGVK